jgi:hypothetical protein
MAVERFRREAQVLSRLSHPHICAIHDVGEEEGVAFLVMEHLEGETLAERLESGALPLEQALEYGHQIATALDEAHSKGIVHRDLKPGNIMSRARREGLDSAWPARPDSTPAASRHPQLRPHRPGVAGTVPYMAPGNSDGADARTDIFAFGIVPTRWSSRGLQGQQLGQHHGRDPGLGPERLSSVGRWRHRCSTASFDAVAGRRSVGRRLVISAEPAHQNGGCSLGYRPLANGAGPPGCSRAGLGTESPRSCSRRPQQPGLKAPTFRRLTYRRNITCSFHARGDSVVFSASTAADGLFLGRGKQLARPLGLTNARSFRFRARRHGSAARRSVGVPNVGPGPRRGVPGAPAGRPGCGLTRTPVNSPS